MIYMKIFIIFIILAICSILYNCSSDVTNVTQTTDTSRTITGKISFVDVNQIPGNQYYCRIYNTWPPTEVPLDSVALTINNSIANYNFVRLVDGDYYITTGWSSPVTFYGLGNYGSDTNRTIPSVKVTIYNV